MTKQGKLSPLERSERAVRAYKADMGKMRRMTLNIDKPYERIIKLNKYLNQPEPRRISRECDAAHKNLIVTTILYYRDRLGDKLRKEISPDFFLKERGTLLSFGESGLRSAIDMFGLAPPRTYHFATYALWWIWKEVLQAIEWAKEDLEEEKEDEPNTALHSDTDEMFEGTPFEKYKNKKGEMVVWDGLTHEERREYKEREQMQRKKRQGQRKKEQREMKEQMSVDIKEHLPEFVHLLYTGMEMSKDEAKRELEALLAAKK